MHFLLAAALRFRLHYFRFLAATALAGRWQLEELMLIHVLEATSSTAD